MKKRQARLEAIYQTAAELICRKGYEATTLGEIGAAVGLTKAGLYHYVKSKDELLYGMVNYAMDRVEEEVVAPARQIEDPKERLRAVTVNYVRLIMRTGGSLTMAIDESNKLQRARARRAQRRRRAFYDFIHQTIESAKEEGYLPGIDASIAALSFFGVILFMAEWYRPGGSLASEEVARQILSLTVDRMLLGDKPKPRKG
jgi:AcrR family transcriptional regulator